MTFTIVDDNVEEVNMESFSLALMIINQPAGVILGETQGTVTITDDDSECAPHIYLSSPCVFLLLYTLHW